jgi:L-ascorbate metabolism protein UlaG (beta-lactamase superfamily)
MPGPTGAGTPDRLHGPCQARGVGRLTYVGHATTLIELDGVALLTDPLLRERFGHVRRIAPPVRDVPRPDAILVSHAHRDHLDLPSLARLPRDVPVFASAAAAEVIRGDGRVVTALAPGEQARVGPLEIVATRADHDGRRAPVGRPREAVGFLVHGTVRLYFAGDTDVFDGMRALSPWLDVALLPIWGWGPRVGPGHLDPERAARAAGLLRPRVAVPIHWGAYASPRVWWRSDPVLPAREFERLAAVHAPGVAVSVLTPGQSLALAPAAAAEL